MIRRARVAALTNGTMVYVTIPTRSKTARFGPCQSLVAGLLVGDLVLVAPFYGTTDSYAVLGKVGGVPLPPGGGGGEPGDIDGGGWVDPIDPGVDGGAW